jgi:chromosome segregation ATPase
MAKIMIGIIIMMGGIGYWYYTDTQNTIAVLTENNAKLNLAVATNEETIKTMAADFAAANEELKKTNAEFAATREQNNQLASKLQEHDLELTAAARPKSVQRLINGGSRNAGRCFELLSGSPLTEKEKNATTDKSFNNECPWLYDTYKSRGLLNSATEN